MKRTAFNVIMSILLILAGLAAQAGGVWGVLECTALEQLDDKFTETLDKITELEDAINQLAEADEQYYAGVTAIYDGEIALSQGRSIVSQGEDALSDGKAKVAQAQAQYDEAQAQLKKAKKVIADAEEEMEASRADYEAGKELLEDLETLTPLLTKYMSFRSKTIEKIPGFRDTQDWYERNVIPEGAELGLTLPDNVEDFEPYMNEKIAEGNAMIEQYELAEEQLAEGKEQVATAEEQLAEAKKQLDKGYAVLDAGQAEIDNANAQLDNAAAAIVQGKKTLDEYDKSVAMLDDGLKEFLALDPVYDSKGNVAVESIAMRLGDGFDWYLRNDDGEVLALKNGGPRLDYDKCLKVCTAYRDYVDDYINDLNDELSVRVLFDLALAAVGLLAVLTAILTLFKRKFARKLSFVLLCLVGLCHAYGIAIGYSGFTYPPEETLYSGLLPFIAAVLLLVVTALHFASVHSKKCAYAEGEAPEKKKRAKKRKPEQPEETAVQQAAVQPEPVEDVVPAVEQSEEVQAAIEAYNRALRRYNKAKQAAERRENK